MYIFEDDAEVEVTPLSSPDSFPYGERYDAEKILLKDYFKAEKQKITYIYDFGDNWEHTIELININDETVTYPTCIGGKGSNMVEDCGRIWGYYNMVEAVNNPEHPEYEEYREWLGMEQDEQWDINAFDLEETNKMLRGMWKRRKKLK